MSGTLVLAAAAQKPVLSSNYGLMGKLVQDYHLGLTLDSTQPREIAKGLTRFLQEPESVLCDRTLMKKFAEQNSAEKFADVIFNHI
jgi:glycosyltransferase involved in cell wall biosynthesis